MNRTQVRRRRGRAVALGLGLALGLGFLGGRASAGPTHQVAARIHVVEPGDTLWGIARGLVGSSGDPRPLVEALIERNHLGGASITVGERLALPQR